MGEKFDCVDPLGFAIASEEFLVEIDVPFGIDSGRGLLWCPFDGAVDLFILEMFVHIAPVARDPSFRRPAVNVSAKWIGRVSEDVHGRMCDAFSWGFERAMVRTYVVPFARKELAVLSMLGIVTTFRLKAKEAHASIIVQGGER